MIDEKKFLHQTVKKDLRTYDSIRNITIGQGDDYTAGYLPFL